MQNNHPNLTFAYHFLCESLIIFLLVLPFLQQELWENSGNYMLTAFAACILFSFLTTYTKSYLSYLLTALPLFIAFYLLNFSLIISILFTVVFIWRYINIRKQQVISRENSYILLTLGLSVFNIFLIQDGRILMYPLLLFGVLIFGYIASHLAVVQKHEIKQFDMKLAVYFAGLLAIGGGLFFFLFDAIRMVMVTIWQGFTGLLEIFFGSIAGLFSFLELPETEIEEEEEAPPAGDPNTESLEVTETSFIEMIAPYVAIAVALAFVIAGVYFLSKLWKKRFQHSNNMGQDEAVSYSDLELGPENTASFFTSWRKMLFNKPEHPVRKMVYQFEQTAVKHHKGRKASETMEDWMKRIGLEAADFTIYEQVRYGEADVSESEANQLKDQIEKLEREMEEKEVDREL